MYNTQTHRCVNATDMHIQRHIHSFNLSDKLWTSPAIFLQISHQFAIISGIQLKPPSTLNPCWAVYIRWDPNQSLRLISIFWRKWRKYFSGSKGKKHFTNVSLFNRLDSRPAGRFWVKGLSAHFLWEQSLCQCLWEKRSHGEPKFPL